MYRHSLRKRITLVAAAGTLAASIGGAQAAPVCPAPTQAQCQDSAFYQTECGKPQQSSKSACATMIKPLAQAAFNAKAGVLQNRVDPIHNVAKMTKVAAYSDPNLAVSGNTAVFSGRAAAPQIAAVKPAAAVSSTGVGNPGVASKVGAAGGTGKSIVGTIILDPKTIWGFNGAKVGSCDEYAYEKYYDYSVFEDQASAKGTDYRAIFNLAYDATVGVANKYLRSKSGQGIALQVFYPYGSGDIEFGGTYKNPKNDYFAGYARAKANGFQLNDPATQTILDGGQVFWDPEGWAWMTARSAELASVPDDKLDALNKKQEEFGKLVDSRLSLQQAYASYGGADRLAQVQAVDQQIRDAIAQAKVEGCIDTTHTTACDFAPRQFWKRFQSHFQSLREHDYQRCVNDTGNNFTTAVNASGIGSGKTSFNDYDYTHTSELLDSFLGNYEWYASHQPTMKDPGTGKTVLGQKAGDSGGFGNDKFGVTYGWDASWQVSGFTGWGQPCNAQTKSLADAWTNGTLFGSVYHLFKAQATADSSTSSAAKIAVDVFMNDSNLYHADKTVGPYHLSASPHLSKKWDASYTWVILAVPVTIRGGINAAAGLDATLDVTTNAACGQNNTVTLAEAKGLVKPWIKADAFASAGVDLFIVEGGVKLTLTLLKAELPFNGDFKVYMQYAPGQPSGTILVDATATLDLDLHTLDGKFSLYIDSWFGDDEETLLSWDGFHVHDRLFSVGRTAIPLLTVKNQIDAENPLVVGGILGTVATAGTLSVASK